MVLTLNRPAVVLAGDVGNEDTVALEGSEG
jgi:hypothetical protein